MSNVAAEVGFVQKRYTQVLLKEEQQPRIFWSKMVCSEVNRTDRGREITLWRDIDWVGETGKLSPTFQFFYVALQLPFIEVAWEDFCSLKTNNTSQNMDLSFQILGFYTCQTIPKFNLLDNTVSISQHFLN